DYTSTLFALRFSLFALWAGQKRGDRLSPISPALTSALRRACHEQLRAFRCGRQADRVALRLPLPRFLTLHLGVVQRDLCVRDVLERTVRVLERRERQRPVRVPAERVAGQDRKSTRLN